MPIETDCREQTAILWNRTGYDDFGRPTIAEKGIEIKVRWEDTKEEFNDPLGNTVSIDTVVVVDREILTGSQMWLGSFKQLPGTAGIPPNDVRYVVRYRVVPDIKGRHKRRLAYLVKDSDSLANNL